MCACIYIRGTSKDSGAYDLGELDQALFLYLDGQQDHHQAPHHVEDQRRKHHCLSFSQRITHKAKGNIFFYPFAWSDQITRDLGFGRGSQEKPVQRIFFFSHLLPLSSVLFLWPDPIEGKSTIHKEIKEMDSRFWFNYFQRFSSSQFLVVWIELGLWHILCNKPKPIMNFLRILQVLKKASTILDFFGIWVYFFFSFSLHFFTLSFWFS